jgi:hypothetical protein
VVNLKTAEAAVGLRLYSRIYGHELSTEETLDIIILQTRRLARLVELQSHTMVSGAEQEEVEFLKRMGRRYVYDLAKGKAAQRAAMSEHARPIVMPALMEHLAATQSSPTQKREKAQSRAIVANKKTAKNSLRS